MLFKAGSLHPCGKHPALLGKPLIELLRGWWEQYERCLTVVFQGGLELPAVMLE